jgi:hypothetical protein
MRLGKIVAAQAHYLYRCQVFRRHEVAEPPSAEDYAFGNFVSVQVRPELEIIGVVSDTILNNPDYGRLGPRLSPESQLEILSPDYLDEVFTEICIFALGTAGPSGPNQRMPRIAPQVGNEVRLLTEKEISDFHGLPHRLNLSYLGRIVGERRPLYLELAMAVLERLMPLAGPEHANMLAVQLNDLQWKLTLEPRR